jgi:hypothetical protein
MNKKRRSWFRYERITASESSRHSLALLIVTLLAAVAVISLTDASWQAKCVVAALVIASGTFVAISLLRPARHYCYAVADSTDLHSNASPYLWLHADGPVAPGTGYISPWGSEKGHGNYNSIGKQLEWGTTSTKGFKTAVCLPAGDYSIDFSALDHHNWEQRLTIERDGRGKLIQKARIYPENDRPFSPYIPRH